MRLLLLLWIGGFIWFAAQIPRAPATDFPAADAIVILTGAPGRIDYGLKLLSDGKAPRVFISGVGKGAKIETQDSRVELGHAATSTFENAEETKAWAEQNHLTRLLLVTSNYHMPRSVYVLHHAMKEAAIIEAPYFPNGATPWWQEADTARLVFIEYHKFLGSLLRLALLGLA